MHRRDVIRALFALAATPALQCTGGGGDNGRPSGVADPAPYAPPPQPDANGRNLLVVLLDDQGPQMGAYGTPGLATPNMDLLASRGARYERAYVTLGICSASRSSLFTGLYNFTSGATHNVQEFMGSAQALASAAPPWFSDPRSAYHRYRIRSPEPTLVELLRAAGYFTGIHNKFHRSPHTRFPFDRWNMLAPGQTMRAQADAFLDAARASGKPWYLEHCIWVTHRPWLDSTSPPGNVDPAGTTPPGHLPDTALVRQDWADYLTSIEAADRSLGEVLAALEASGQADNTVIVLMGDNGIEYHRGKASTYDMGLHVPLLWRAPDVAAGRVVPELFSGVDLLPTLLDFLGLVTAGRVHGVSHHALLTGTSSSAPRPHLVGLAPGDGSPQTDRSITDGRFQLIYMPDPFATEILDDLKLADPWRNRVYQHIVDNRDTPGFEEPYRLLDLADATLPRFTRPTYELYDLAADPWELEDLAADGAHSETLARLKTALRDWMQHHEDPAPRPA